MNNFKTLLFIGTTVVISNIGKAKDASPNFCGSAMPAAAIELSGITKTLYGIVSGEAGSKRDWQLMRQMFAPNATISPVFHNTNGRVIERLSVEEFIALNKKVFANVNFFETEIKSKVYRFGHSATIISQYESRDKVNAEPYSTGVNSFQLVNDGNRWCVISVTWDSDKGPYPTSHFKLQ